MKNATTQHYLFWGLIHLSYQWMPGMRDKGCVLAFDFGVKRIGVAVGEAELSLAHPLSTIQTERNDQRFLQIQQLIEAWQPVALVVGEPVHMDGSEHEITLRARRFAHRLKGRFRLPVYLVDERYTSLMAESMLHEACVHGRKQKPVLDQVAAQTILQTWFEQGGQLLS